MRWSAGAAAAAGIATRLGNHSFRATQLYDRRRGELASMRWRGLGSEAVLSCRKQPKLKP
jgi:hypothetical protein